MDIDDLQKALGIAIEVYRADAERAVRSGSFISPIHDVCARELARNGLAESNLVPAPGHGGYLPPRSKEIVEEARTKVRGRLRGASFATLREQLLTDLDQIEKQRRKRRLRVLGGYLEKEIDVCYIVEDTGPLLAISVKSQMSSIAKNAINRFEEYVGDAANLHTRYPLLVLGFLLLVPVSDETFDETGAPKDLLYRVEALLEQATGRVTGANPGSYEASTLLVVDFNQTPPTIHPSFPAPDSPLRIEGFFERLMEQYRQRNRTLV